MIIRRLVEENERLREQLSKAQLDGDVEPVPAETNGAPDGPKAQLMDRIDRLRASVDACAAAILTLKKTSVENEE